MFGIYIWVGDIRGRCAGLKNRERWFDSTPSHQGQLVRLVKIPTLAVDDRARTLGYSETIRARTARQIRATVKQYARLAWVYCGV